VIEILFKSIFNNTAHDRLITNEYIITAGYEKCYCWWWRDAAIVQAEQW